MNLYDGVFKTTTPNRLNCIACVRWSNCFMGTGRSCFRYTETILTEKTYIYGIDSIAQGLLFEGKVI